MKKLFFTFFLILLAIFLGFLVHKDPGYVLLAYNGWTLETSIWVALVCGFILFLAIYFLVRLVHHTAELGERWHDWRKRRRHNKMLEKIELGIFDCFSGEWGRGEKKFNKAAALDRSKSLAFLGAAFCAYQKNEFEQCERYLDAARQVDPRCELATLFLRAQIVIQQEDWEAAKTLAQQLKKRARKNKFTLELQDRLRSNSRQRARI